MLAPATLDELPGVELELLPVADVVLLSLEQAAPMIASAATAPTAQTIRVLRMPAT
jgi:hypothetical protein